MKYRTFGRMGWKVSEIGFGAWAIGGSWGPQDDSDSLAALNRRSTSAATSSTPPKATATARASG